MPELSKIESLHKPLLTFDGLEKASELTAEDIKNLSATALYEVVMKHWAKCSPCAQALLIKHKVEVVRDAAVFFASQHEGFSVAVA
jgi:hypothetical protein